MFIFYHNGVPGDFALPIWTVEQLISLIALNVNCRVNLRYWILLRVIFTSQIAGTK